MWSNDNQPARSAGQGPQQRKEPRRVCNEVQRERDEGELEDLLARQALVRDVLERESETFGARPRVEGLPSILTIAAREKA